jgi:hypothetical protein
MSRARGFSISARIILPLAAEIDPASTQAPTIWATPAPRCIRSSDRSIISLKRWFITARRPSAANMQRPCGMLLSAVSNWPASAASRSRATSACMNILCKLAEIWISATVKAAHTTDMAM